MENKCKECYKCRNFNRYYVKRNKEFHKVRFGWCCKKKETQSIHETCENFSYHPTQKRRSYEYLLFDLSNLLDELSAIRNIIEEENRETEEEL